MRSFNCPYCGKDHDGPLYKYCSEDCRHKAVNEKRRLERLGIRMARPVQLKPCKTCGTLFTPAPHGLHLYCSLKCCPSVTDRKQYAENKAARFARKLKGS